MPSFPQVSAECGDWRTAERAASMTFTTAGSTSVAAREGGWGARDSEECGSAGGTRRAIETPSTAARTTAPTSTAATSNRRDRRPVGLPLALQAVLVMIGLLHRQKAAKQRFITPQGV